MIPVAIGVGVTAAALAAKAAIHAGRRYRRLLPQMIAALNKIRLESPVADSPALTHAEASHINYLRSRFNNSGFGHTMTEREALLILGIEASDIDSLTQATLRQRYRLLMVQNHPDKKGSVYLSQKINQAKDVLEQSYMFRNK